MSKYNPVFQFDYLIKEKEYQMIFTSIKGHLMNWEFPAEFKKWDLDTVATLYDTQLTRTVNQDCREIEQNLKKYSKDLDLLILWLDCDREGENIAFEVIDIVSSVNSKIDILRANFSALTKTDIIKAINNLQYPNKNLSDGVEIRQKIDLLIGASFTILQTLVLKKIFYPNYDFNSSQNILSYGPCQFPTLNFIVERTEKILHFISEEFYYLDIKLTNIENNLKFVWKRNRLFNQGFTQTLYDKVNEVKTAYVKKVIKKPTTRLRPLPLNTVEFQKLATRKLKISPHEAMEIAEKLYSKGYISYPRTESQRYSFSENLKKYVQYQNDNPFWGDYAKKLIKDDRYNNPRRGVMDDKSHPPIHPVKYPDMKSLSDKEIKIYDLITRHFLASVSPDAKAEETTVEIEIVEEIFSLKGLRITDIGYYLVFNYDKWDSNFIPLFTENQEFNFEIVIKMGKTSPPHFLSEADLISLMDKHGIGTDETISEHIKTIQDRKYAILKGPIFKPSLIGTTLVKMYQHLGIELFKPNLRVYMEREIKDVCDGKKQKDTVYFEMKNSMRYIFDKVYEQRDEMTKFVIKYLNENQNYPQEINLHNFETTKFIYNQNKKNGAQSKQIEESTKQPKIIDKDSIISNCPTCKVGKIRVILSNGNNYFIGCTNFPTCRHSGSLSNQPIDIIKSNLICKICSKNDENVNLFELKYANQSEISLCLANCFSHNKPINIYL